MSVDFARLQLEADSTQVRKASTDLQHLERQSGRTEQATDKFSSGLKTMALRLGAAAAAYISVSQAMNLVVSSVREYAVFEQQMKRLEAQIQATGRTGQTTASDLERMAQAIDKATLQSAQGVRNAQAILMSFRNVSTDMMERILYVASDVSEVMGQDITSAARQMALALEDPQRGITMLRRTGTTFTEQQKEMIIQLHKSGDALAAQSAILDVMESQYGGTAKAAADGLAGSMDLLSRNTTNFRIQIGEYLAPVIKDLTDDLAETTEQLTGSAGLMYGISITVDAIAIFSRTFELAGKTVALIFATLNAAAWELTGVLVSGPIKALEYIVELYNKIPKLPDIQLPKGLTDFSDTIIASTNLANQTVIEGVKSINDLINRPLPGNAIRDSFGDIEEQAEKARRATGNLTDDTNDLTEALKELQEQAAFEQDAAIKAIGYREEAIQEYWQQYIESMNAVIAREKAAYEDAQQAKTDAEEQARRDREQREEQARQDYLREWKRVYDDMHKFAADTFYDIFDGQLDSFEDFADSMLDIFKRMLANMAAEAAMTNIFKPMMQSMAGSAMGNLFGLPTMGGGSGFNIPGVSNIGRLFGLGGSGNLSNSIGILGQQTGLWGGGLANGVSTYSLSSGVGAGQFGGVGSTTPLGGFGAMSSIGNMMGTGVLTFAAAQMVKGIMNHYADKPQVGFRSSTDPLARTTILNRAQKEGPDFSYGLTNELGERGAGSPFEYYMRWRDVDDSGMQRAFYDYFDTVFMSIEDALGISMNEVLKASNFSTHTAVEGGVSIKKLSKDVFSNVLEEMITAAFPESDMVDKTTRELVALGHNPNVEGTLSDLSPVYEDVTRSVSVLADIFNEKFFKAITPEEGNEWDAFIQFANVVENTADFMGSFTRRVEELGQTAVEAYQQIQLVSGVMAEIGGMVDAVTTTSAFSTEMNNINTVFDAFVLTLKDANATVNELNEAEQARNQLLGTRITGLTGSALQQALTGGGDIDSILQKSIMDALAAGVADSITEKYLGPLNKTVGALWNVTGGDMDAVLSLLENYDLSGARDEIRAFKDEMEDMFGEMGDNITEDLSIELDNARDALDRAIDKEWELVNARLSAADQIDSLINSLMGGSLAPVQSLEFFEKRYSQLLSEAQSAETAEEIDRAVSNLTSFAPQYLEFAQAYGGDYKSVFDQVTSELSGIEKYQRSEAEAQIQELERIEYILGDTKDAVLSIDDALAQYLAVSKDHGEHLRNIASSVMSLTMMDSLQKFFENPVVSGIGDFIGNLISGGGDSTTTTGGTPGGTATHDPVKALYASIGRTGFGDEPWQIDQSGYDYWTKQAQFMSVPELTESFYTAVRNWMDANPEDPLTDYIAGQGLEFAGGGVISGPSSGYQLPGATYHGTEAIVPMNGSAIPVVVQNENNQQNLVSALKEAISGADGKNITLNVNLLMGQHVFNAAVRETIMVDDETQLQIRRVVNG